MFPEGIPKEYLISIPTRKKIKQGQGSLFKYTSNVIKYSML